MIRALILAAALCLTWIAAKAEVGLPRCQPAMEGQVSEAGCTCGYDRGGILAGRAGGWRWTCDLLRGPGAEAPVVSAGPAPQPLPPGVTYAPQMGNSQAGSSPTGSLQTGSPLTGSLQTPGSRFGGRSLGY